MTPPIISESQYKPNNFQFNGIEYPKDDYIQVDTNSRVLSKFNSTHAQNVNDKNFYEVYYFILNHIIPKYEELTSCNMLHEDIECKPSIIFSIRFKDTLEFPKRNNLHINILEEICEFCDSSNFSSVFEEITILLVGEIYV